MSTLDTARKDGESADENVRFSFNRRSRPPEPLLSLRTRYRAAALAIALACAALSRAVAGPVETNELPLLAAHHAPSLTLLARNTIRVVGRGTLPVDFRAALRVLSQSNLLDRVQEEYARSLPAGRQPEFVLHPAGSNTWTFVNRHGQHSEVCEVARIPVATNALAAVFYAKGERFFGLFESLTVIRAVANDQGQIGYTVQVLAYPHQPVCRFVIRHLGLVERYFQNKTKELEVVSARICGRLCDPAVVAGPDDDATAGRVRAARTLSWKPAAGRLESRKAPADPLEPNSHRPAIPFSSACGDMSAGFVGLAARFARTTSCYRRTEWLQEPN